MATKSYDAWAKFDVDRELERVDERMQQEEQARAAEQQQRAKLRVEDAVTSNAEQSAQVLAAHAAVAALKAKARAKKEEQARALALAVAATARTGDEATAAPCSNQTEAAQTDRESAVAAQLERHAALFAKKHELVKCIMLSRREGDAALQRANTTAAADEVSRELQHALVAFEQALGAAQTLETIAPDVLAVEKEQRVLQTAQCTSATEPSQATANAGAKSHERAHDHEHGPSCHGATGACSHTRKTAAAEHKTPSPAPLPKPEDLSAIVKMFFVDVYAGIGACHLQQKRLAAASEAFKHVLLRDDLHVHAWLERGRAFELMGATLLAMLHYSRAAALDAKSESARECLERVNELLLSDADDVLGKLGMMLELHRLLTEFRDAEDSFHRASAAAAAAYKDGEASGGAVQAPTIAAFDEAAYRLGKYQDGALVRLRGVVCDVQDPELVLLAAPGERDVAAVLTDASGEQQFIERVPLKVALFPHRTEWAQRAYDAGLPVTASASDRSIAEAIAASSKGTKRSSEAIGHSAVDSVSPPPSTVPASEASAPPSVSTAVAQDAQKRAKGAAAASVSADASATGGATSASAPYTVPFLQDLVNVYVYDRQYKDVSLDAFKVNEAFDFVGVLDLLVLGSARGASDSAADASLSPDALQRLHISDCLDELEQRQRAGAVIHCCDATAITPLHHVRPHQPRSFYTALLAPQSNAARTQFCVDEWSRLGVSSSSSTSPSSTSASTSAAHALVQSIRTQLIAHVAAVALDGDLLAAEYLVLALLARVYARPDASTPLGNLSLNLILSRSGASSSSRARVARIQAAVEALVPVARSLDLGLATLNAQAFVPQKDYTTDAMTPGVLQVPHGTVLVVDETALAAGALNDQGVRNVGALQSLVSKMLLPYDFQYYSMDFPQDVAVVTVSEGKSILPVTVAVPIVETASDGATVASAATTEDALLACFRVYLSVMRSLDVAIGNEQADVAEKHYVACRQAKQEVSLDDLHRWLRVARLVALSQGDDEVSTRAWDHMLALEDRRLERLQATTST